MRVSSHRSWTNAGARCLTEVRSSGHSCPEDRRPSCVQDMRSGRHRDLGGEGELLQVVRSAIDVQGGRRVEPKGRADADRDRSNAAIAVPTDQLDLVARLVSISREGPIRAPVVAQLWAFGPSVAGMREGGGTHTLDVHTAACGRRQRGCYADALHPYITTGIHDTVRLGNDEVFLHRARLLSTDRCCCGLRGRQTNRAKREDN